MSQTTKTTSRTRIGTITIQGIAHWHRPKEWAWPNFKTDFEWCVTGIDLDHGIMTVEFFAELNKE